ncbi:glycosyltransferase family 1 protein [Trichococcus sp. K1Tr]|uniref:glycosyltransferase family 1 protein n=1 Tax=Trichococcus sp. K1Tr TaxID=3020847 RepID=UPI00232F68BE|nr:glycosyltransferase family 1 protein [Trichococcus sp. K1Tr]MDB6353564.1 glycosyltransferase family 1 protein [Trichococcus sp. K1Tr]
MKEPIRILHVFGRLDRGGAETMIMNIYRKIDKNIIQFDFVVHTRDKCDYDQEIKELGGRIYSIPKYEGLNYSSYNKAWNVFFKDHPQYKLIHGHVRSTASIYLRIAKKYGLISISHSHNTSSGKGMVAFAKNLMQYPIRYIADDFFACSLYAGEWLFGKKVCQKDNFFILKNAIDVNAFRYNEAVRTIKRRELNLAGKFVIGHIGRFHPQKNHMFLVEVFKKVHDRNENTVLLLIGEGEQRAKVEEKVNKLGLTEHVLFTGVRDDIPQLIQAMDVFVFPSLFEGLGIAIVEAQASGLKCIVADTIPSEAFVTDIVESLPLNSKTDIWANKILEKSSNYKRNDVSQAIFHSGYDIKETAKWLQDFYIRKHEDRGGTYV